MRKFYALLAAVTAFVGGTAEAQNRVDNGGGVSSRLLHIIDDKRQDPLDPMHKRQWYVEIVYPSKAPARPTPDPYIDQQYVDELVRQKYYGQTPDTIRSWGQMQSGLDIGASARTGRRPLILLSPGLGVIRRHYIKLAEAFARRGFVVAIVDHPYIGTSILPDGRILRADDDPIFSSEDLDAMKPRISDWVSDLSVIIDRLIKVEKESHQFGINLKRIASVGHSIGGTVALDACRDDRRIKVCIDFEGAPMGSDFFEKGGTTPTLIVLSHVKRTDDELAKLGRTREDSEKFLGKARQQVVEVLAKSSAPAWFASVTGGGHLSFSDAPFVMPSTITQFGGAVMTPERAFTVYPALATAFITAFFPGGGGERQFFKSVATLSEVSVTKAR